MSFHHLLAVISRILVVLFPSESINKTVIVKIIEPHRTALVSYLLPGPLCACVTQFFSFSIFSPRSHTSGRSFFFSLTGFVLQRLWWLLRLLTSRRLNGPEVTLSNSNDEQSLYCCKLLAYVMGFSPLRRRKRIARTVSIWHLIIWNHVC